jgi:DNA-damage-inducible protein J
VIWSGKWPVEKKILPLTTHMQCDTMYMRNSLEGGFTVKDTSISIRVDSKLKENTESVLVQFGLNMTTIVNMLFHQIVREQAIPLSLSLTPNIRVMEDLNAARLERQNGYKGRTANNVADDMERIILEAEREQI